MQGGRRSFEKFSPVAEIAGKKFPLTYFVSTVASCWLTLISTMPTSVSLSTHLDTRADNESFWGNKTLEMKSLTKNLFPVSFSSNSLFSAIAELEIDLIYFSQCIMWTHNTTFVCRLSGNRSGWPRRRFSHTPDRPGMWSS